MEESPGPDLAWRRARTAALIASGCLAVAFFLGAVLDAPSLWGVNALRFLPTGAWITLIAFSAALGIPSVADRLAGLLEFPFGAGRPAFLCVVTALAVSSIAVMLEWRISTDIYGDTRTLVDYLAVHEYTFADLMNLGEEKEPLTRMIHQKISRLSGLDIASTFRILSCVAGGLAFGATALFLRDLKGDNTWKMTTALAVVTAGVNQLYFGHVEDYALPALGATLLLFTGWRLIEGGESPVPLLIVFVVCLFLHLMSVAYLPAVAYAVVRSVRRPGDGTELRPAPPGLFVLVGASLAAAFLAYLFVFRAWELPDYSSKARLDAVFLPVVNPLPHPHSYSLFSPAHLWDVLQELLYVVSPVAIVCSAAALSLRLRAVWDRPEAVFLGLAFFYQFLFTATVDPLLSIVRDWDLLSQVALPGTLLGAALMRPVFARLGDARRRRTLAGLALAPALMASSIFYVNSDEEAISKRVRSAGEWAFASYWVGSSYVINVGEGMIPDPAEEARSRARTIDRIRHLRSPVDAEFGFLQFKLALRQFTLGRYEESERRFEAALEADPGFATDGKFLAQNKLLLRKFDEAEELITAYNDLVNVPEVSDFNGLIVAQFTNQIHYLRRMGADSSRIGEVLAGLSERIRKGDIP